MSPTNLLVPSFIHLLGALHAWLEKAETHVETTGMNKDDLMALSLAPDMYPLSAQVRFACFQALEPAYRLRAIAIPENILKIREEGWVSREQPGSLADSRRRIQETLSLLADLPKDALDTGSDLPIALDLPNGIIFDMTGDQYARDWALPQFYFHLNTAYAILRNHGVDLGKIDYVPQMFAYLRPGTMPEN